MHGGQGSSVMTSQSSMPGRCTSSAVSSVVGSGHYTTSSPCEPLKSDHHARPLANVSPVAVKESDVGPGGRCCVESLTADSDSVAELSAADLPDSSSPAVLSDGSSDADDVIIISSSTPDDTDE